MAIVDWRCTPNIAINDPLLMVGMPPALTAATGMDALTHAVEAYVSTIATPITDSAADKAIELIAKYLRPAVANGQDIDAREGMAYAEYLAGMAFNNASLGYVHAMAHQLGGFYNLPHGVCNAILLPHVSKFNLIAKMDRFVNIAELMGENSPGTCAEGCRGTGSRRHPQAFSRYRHSRRTDRIGQTLRQGCQGRGHRYHDHQRPEGCLRFHQSPYPQGC